VKVVRLASVPADKQRHLKPGEASVANTRGADVNRIRRLRLARGDRDSGQCRPVPDCRFGHGAHSDGFVLVAAGRLWLS
jgi:hypothetical protein